MSYILDALKKAEAERNVGNVPGLHTQPIFAAGIAVQQPVWRRYLPLWASLVLLTLLGILFIATKFWPSPFPTPADVVPPASTPKQASTPELPSSPSPQPSAPVALQTNPAADPPLRSPRRTTASEKAPAEKKPARAEVTAARKTEKEAKPAAESTSNKELPVPLLQELPEDIRRQIPALTINGYIYSTNKADRTVLINQRLLHEGNQVAPDLILEKLNPQSMILNFKGYRYRTSY